MNLNGKLSFRRSLITTALWEQSADVVKLFFYILARAAWIDYADTVSGNIIHRGQHLTSFRSIAADNSYPYRGIQKHWNAKTVSGYLDILKSIGLIEYESNTAGTLITIRVYDDFQMGVAPEVTPENAKEVTERATPGATPIKKNLKRNKFEPPDSERARRVRELSSKGML